MAVMIRERSLDRVVHSPISPPGMTTSKSSKSSSFQSVTSEDGVIADAGHFEDIGLDDDNSTLKSPSNLHPRRPPLSPLPGHRPYSNNAAVGRNLAGSPASRAPRPRRSFPNLHSNVRMSDPRSTSLTVLTEPRSVSPSNTKSRPTLSTTSLPLTHRHRSPSPIQSLNSLDPNIPIKPRRGSWQANRDRKSLGELEQACDEDEGDDIPDGLVLDNVPISPRPPQERPPSRSTSRAPSASVSPERSPKERVRSIGNGTPAVAQAQGSLRSPNWKSNQFQRGPPSPLKARAHSWNAAHSELNLEAKALTEKLEEHADEIEKEEEHRRARRPSGSARPNTWNSSRNATDHGYDKKERIKSTPELPPLRRSNIMIDPLPISKEKEAVLSRTRPSWLPPKDPAEERRHLREYQKMMVASAKAAERREVARQFHAETKDTVAENMMNVWEKDIIPRWSEAMSDPSTRELWWRGVPPRSRGAVWSRAIGNGLGLTEASFHAALSRAKELEVRLAENRADAEDARRSHWLQQIRSEVQDSTWTDLRIFQEEGPLHQSLVDVLSAYAMYRNDVGYVSGCNNIAALLLLNFPDPESTFIALANILNRPLPLSFYTSDVGAQSSTYNLTLQTLSVKSSTLYDHLTSQVLSVGPEYYLGDGFLSLFTRQLAVDEVSRLWDVYVFEGDAILIRAAVAILLRNEMALSGATTADEVRSVVLGTEKTADSPPSVGEVGAEELFMRLVREAGKASAT